MKLLGLSCGRKMQNSEILLREALMGAEELGAEVSMIRLLDLDIRPCKGCMTCTMSLMNGGAGDCVIKDDFPFLDDQLLECDGMILSAPTYVLAPPGLIKVIADRRGPSRDLAWLTEAKKVRENMPTPPAKGPDERAFKKRVAAFINVGGASTANWLSLGLPLMYLFTFPSNMTVIDQMQMTSMTRFMNPVLNPDALARAKRLGRNVAEAMKQPAEELRWMGEEGLCPVCHSDLLTVKATNPVECPICGIAGTLKVEGDRISVVFKEEDQQRSRIYMAGKVEHWVELRENVGMFMKRPDAFEIPKRVEKYESYGVPVLTPPGKNGKGPAKSG
ncbi:MAG: flavodoxin family protein [Syntrophorhabdales bacterium]|jgi:multimeric flavodoxin WrbA